MVIITVSRRRLWWAATVAVTALMLLAGFAYTGRGIVEYNDKALAIPVDASLQPGLRPIYAAKTDEKVIALTFDISWGKVMAPKVIEILKQENVKATFFLSGPWAENHIEMVKQIQTDGHQIESHGQKHVDLNTLGRQGAAENIAEAHAILERLTGQAPSYIRPPNGAFNKDSVQAARDLNYATVIWSVDSLDWKNPGVDTIVRRSTRLIHPGAILLMHASDSCKQTDQALPTVINTLRQQGYKFVPLDDLVRNYGVDNNGFIHTKVPQTSQ